MKSRWHQQGVDGWMVIEESNEEGYLCYSNTYTTSSGMWQSENRSTPFFLAQLGTIMMVSYLFKRFLAPLHQPRFVSNLLAGVILGPSWMFNYEFMQRNIFSYTTTWTSDTIAYFGVIYYVFLIGLEADFKPILHARKKVLSIATAGIVFPFLVGYLLHTTHTAHDHDNGKTTAAYKRRKSVYGPLIWAITLSSTNFGELTGLLAKAKLLHSDVGRTALSASIVTDLVSWVFLVVTVASASDSNLYTVLSTFVLIIIFVFALRPALAWMVRYTDSYDVDQDHQICFFLAGALACGYVSDACGAHSILGAFMWGAITPKQGGELKKATVKKVEGFLSSLLLPVFFTSVGMRLHVKAILGNSDAHNIEKDAPVFVLAVIVLAFLSKFLVTFVAAIINKMPTRDSLALGLVMNTKGILTLVILVSGRDLKVLDRHTYVVMIAAVLLMTSVVGPVLSLMYKRNRSSSQRCKRKSIRSLHPNSQFRILTCIHSTSNVPSIINLLKASNPTKQSPICVFAVHLVELSGHASAMLIVHDSCKTKKATTGTTTTSSSKLSNTQNLSMSSTHIVSAFENFETESEEGSLSSSALTVVSSYTSMHEDVCNIAEEKSMDLIIVPFHKKNTLNGVMDTGNPSVRDFNKNLLENAPCSVAIFVDRGLTDLSRNKNGNAHYHHRCAMLFIGGPDDREALAYAWRMASNLDPNPKICLTVVRLIVGKDAIFDSHLSPNTSDHHEDENENILQVTKVNEKEKQLDDQYIDNFLLKTRNQPSIKLINEVVNNGEETLKLVSDIGSDYDLYIVGRGQRTSSPLIFGISELGDCPEIGPLGDALVSSSFVGNASVLIVHQSASLVDELVNQHLN